MQFEYTNVYNFEGAFRGMRNPMNSWDKSDSYFNDDISILGQNDLTLAQNLIKAGSEHAKFMRQIFVSVDITAPLFFWKQFDTYKIGTVANSTSTMHKLTSAPITEEMFAFDGLECISKTYIKTIVNICEELRIKFNESTNLCYWRALIEILPSAYLQKRTITMSYANLQNIYSQRRHHKLNEWLEFCNWIKTLPYAEELIIGENNEIN